MPLRTTVIGSYPKPAYLKQPDWFSKKHMNEFSPDDHNQFMKAADKDELKTQQTRAMKEVIEKQIDLGIDVITDGEICRENYMFHFCRHVPGFDFENLTRCIFRNGACESDLPTVTGKVTVPADNAWVAEEWSRAQALSTVPVKYTLPGPLTIASTSKNMYYKNTHDLCCDLVPVIRQAVVTLADAGCKYIQIDEPVLVREPKNAMEFGVDNLGKCFEDVADSITKCVHLCCGYPSYLDQTDYLKADKDVYMQLAEKIDSCGVDHVSIEDAHRHNDLSLLEKFKKTTVVFGVIAIAKSHVETVDEIKSRVSDALLHIPAERLVLAPDCGLGYLPTHILEQKLRNMVLAAKSFS